MYAVLETFLNYITFVLFMSGSLVFYVKNTKAK